MTPPFFHRRFLLPLAAALLTGCTKAPTPPDEPPPAPVTWQAATLAAPGEWVELVGAAQPLPGNVGRITAPIEGRVDALLVVKNAEGKVVKQLHEGDEIAQGEPIVYLDDRIARLNRDKAESAVSTAEQEVAQAQTANNLAAANLASQLALQKKDPSLVPDVQLRPFQAAAQDAQLKLLTAQQRRDQAKTDVKTLDAQIGLYTLTAPIKGRLGRIQASVGQTLSAGADVAEIVNIEDQIDVLCFVSQRDAAGLQTGQDAGLGGLDERAGEARSPDGWGQVAYVSDKAEPESGCFVVKVRFPNKDPHLRGNVVQRVRVQTKAGEEQLCIPEAALIEDQNPPIVVIVEKIKTKKNDEGKEEQVGKARRMRALIAVRDRVLKLVGVSGLEDADGKKYTGSLNEVQFVTEGAQGLETGDAVRLQQKED